MLSKHLVQQVMAFVSVCVFCPQESTASVANWSYDTTSDTADASDVALPLLSFFIPGSGQWIRGQARSGAAYSLAALSSTAYAINASRDLNDEQMRDLDITSKNVALRKYILGLQTGQSVGGISLYHSFRSAVWQRQQFGDYAFLGAGESPFDILVAPFQFQFLSRSSTWIPLVIGGAASWYIATHPTSGVSRTRLSREDAWFAGGFSYNAGTHEEAVFRGWMMPVFRHSGMTPLMSNVAQASVFAMTHLSSTPLPLPQFFLGLHLGSVTLRNNWNLSESVFIHAWWDVLAFISAYHLRKTSPRAQSSSEPNPALAIGLPIMLPPLNLTF